jgi:salicylate hydroxylase
MVNHMAQGAATSMEDGAFLGRAIGAVVQGKISMKEAISIYEKTRMPLAHVKQQVSFLNGAIWHLPDGPLQEVSREFQKGICKVLADLTSFRRHATKLWLRS